jgi:hypothetical protein
LQSLTSFQSKCLFDLKDWADATRPGRRWGKVFLAVELLAALRGHDDA